MVRDEVGTGCLKMPSAPQQTRGETELEQEMPHANSAYFILFHIQHQQLASKTGQILMFLIKAT